MNKGDFLNQKILELEEIQQRYGYVRPQITAQHGEYRFVAVNSRIYYDKKWKTFHDFLSDYLSSILGTDWCNSQLKKPYQQMHQMSKWYKDFYDWRKTRVPNKEGIHEGIMTGSTAAWFHLAYNLYILHHHAILQERLVSRLKNSKQFQGARYELTITASFVRAGFRILLEDESDISLKHPEFVAIHQRLGDKVAVEAKSRHRPGILGHEGEKEPSDQLKAGINQLLGKALKKNVALPYIVCIDLNLPAIKDPIFENSNIKEIMETISRREKKHKKGEFPISLIIITNFPHHYVGVYENDPRKAFFMSPTEIPKYKFLHNEILNEITRSFKQYGNIPSEFEDNKN